MSFPNRPPYGASSPTPWSPSAGAGRGAPPGASPGRWTPVGSARGGGAQPWASQPGGWAGVPPPGRPVTPVRSPGGRATPVQLMSPPSRPAPARTSPARSVTPVTPARHPPPPGHQGTRDGRPMTPQRLFSPSRMMSSPAPQAGGPARAGDEPQTAHNVIDKQSQEYVDEKLAEFQAAIHHLQDEQERVQKKTFLNWINSYLRKHQPPMQIRSLIDDLKDGSRLLALLQVLSGQKLPVERGRILKRAHFLSNANTALQFLHSKNIKLVNINPSDIVDGRPAVVLGLIWTVILYFQIEENTRVLEQLARRSGVNNHEPRSATATPTGPAPRGPSAGQAGQATRGGARRTLLNWARTATKSYGIDINNFGSSWRDGKAFVAIVHCINPTCIDVNAVERMATQDRLEKVFKVAEEDLGIARLLDPEDVNVPEPDEKSIMTYVAQFLHKYPDPQTVAQPVSGAAHSPSQEVDEIVDWVSRTRQLLSALRPPQQDDFMSFKSVKNDASDRYLRYEKLKTLGLPVPAHVWTRVDEEWNSLERLLSEWQTYLDSRLPEPLLSVVQWITGAETFLEASDDTPTDADEHTAKLLTASLEEHMSFFGELPRVEAELRRGAQLPAAAQLPAQQLAHIEKRLKAVRGQAHRRWVRLKYLEHRCCIIAFLILMEGRVRAWTVKLGRQPRVEQMLHEYQTFVSDRNVFHEFEQAFIEMKQVADAFVKEGGVDLKEKEVVVHFINEVGERWRSVSVELQCLRSMLEEVLSCWKKFSHGRAALTAWMDTAETMLNRSEEQKLEFFQDLPSWSERYQETEDSGQFLTATCQDDVAADVHESLQQLQSRWQQLFKHVKRYMQSGQIRQRLLEFSEATSRPRHWAERAETLLSAPLPCRQPQLAQRRQEAQALLAELPDVEADLKTASKLIQMLGEDVSPEKQQEMMQTLKQLRDAVSSRQTACQQQADVCVQAADRLTAAGRGQAEVSGWLDELVTLLDGHHRPPTDTEQIASRAEQLQTVLSRRLYSRSLLESTTKIVSGLLEAVRPVPAVDTAELETEQEAVSRRFAELTGRADQLHQELTVSSEAWRRFETAVQGVTEWLDTADQMLAERADTDHVVEQHKRMFYEAPTDRLTDMSDLGRELFETLPTDGRESVKSTVTGLHDRWQRTVERGPAHLARLEVLATLSQLGQHLTELERQLAAEDHAIHRGGELAQLADTHRQTVEPLTQLIDAKLAEARETCHRLGSQDGEVLTQLRSLEDRWRHLQRRSDAVSGQLEQMSARWSEYEQRRQQTGDWLNRVEQSLQSDAQNIESPEQLQQARETFQAVFGELSQRKQTMRWLVSTLDALVTSLPGPEVERQRQQLSDLVMRYKDLVPRLESTAVQLDGLAKCHTYRVEIDEIVRVLYEARAESAAVPTTWESADQLGDSRLQQQRAVQMLEEQRPRVLAAVQRGRDLHRDLARAPAVLPEALEELEQVWAQSNAEVIQRLDSATEMERLWTELADRQADLQCALSAHRSALSAVSEAGEPGPALAELVAHVQTHQPERAQQMQRRLQQIAEQLTGRLTPEAAQQLTKQVNESGAEVTAVTNQLQQRVDALTSAAQTWEQVSERVEAVRLGLQSAQRGQQRLSTLDMPPETRRQQLQQLTQQLQLHTDERQQLAQLMDTLQNDGYDAGQFSSELAILADTLDHMKETADQQRAVLEEEYKHWQTYQEQVGELVPWLDWAEEKVAADLPRPAKLEEATDILQQCQQFEDQCIDKEPAVKVLVDESAQMVQVFNVSDQADSLVTRWTKVRETSVAWVQQMQSLVSALQGVHTELGSVREWLDQVSAAVPPQEDVPDANQELDSLQPAVSEMPGRQSAVLGLQQRCDQLADMLTPEGAAALRSHVAALRTEISQLNQNLRQRQAKTADAVSQREETYRRLTTLTGWLDGLKSQLAEFDRVQIDSLWECLTSLASLQQELTMKLPSCESVREDATSLYNERPSKENAQLRDDSEQLCTAARQAQTAVTDRHQAVGLWTDLASHSKRLGDHLSAMSDRLQSDALTAEKVPELKQNLATLQCEQTALEAEAAALGPAAERAGLTVLRGQQEQPPQQLSSDTLRHLQQLMDQLDEHDGRLAERQQVWEKFCGDRDGLVTWLEATRSRVSDEQSRCARLDDLPELLSQLDSAQREADSRTDAFQALHQESQAVLESDPGRFSEVHEEVVNLDRAWNALRQTMTETTTRHQALRDAWAAVQQALQAAAAAVSGAETFQQGLGTAPGAAAELEKTLTDGRRAAERLAAARRTLTAAVARAHAAAAAAGLGECLESELQKAEVPAREAQCDELRAKLERVLPDLESAQVLWAQAARAQDEGLRWVAAARQTLRSAADGAAGLRETGARLEQCRHELAAHQTAARTAAEKADEVTRLLGAAEVPALDSGRRRLAEELVSVETALRGTQDTLDGLVSREAALRAALGRCAESAIELRQRVAKLDDPAGTPEEMVSRLQKADECTEAAVELETALAAVQTDIDVMKEEALPTSTYQKEHSLLAAKLKNIKTQLKRVTALLGGSLEKKFTLLLKDSKKHLSALTDKLNWLESAPAEDRPAVEARRAVLAEVSLGVESARAVQTSLRETAGQYLAALPEQKRPAVTAALEGHQSEIDEIAGREADAEKRTAALLDKWAEFETAAAEVSRPLAESEATELPAGQLTSPDEIEPHRAAAEQSVARLQGLSAAMERATALAAELAALSADCAAPQQARQLEARLEAQQRLTAAQLRRLSAAAEASDQYRQAEQAMTAWLAEARDDLTRHEAVLAASRPTLGQQQRMKSMREALGRCHDGQQYLTAATTPAEQLLAELAPPAREAVRAELRALRDSWERLLDDANQALKKLEALVLQLSSFDDCFRQVVNWLDGAEAQLEDEPEPRATLPEKAAVLRDELARRQEVQLRQHMVAQLRDRAELAADGAPPVELADCLRRYDTLERTVGERVERAQSAVDRHQTLARAQQAVSEWLAGQQGRLAAVLAEDEAPDALLPAVERLQAAAKEGLGLLRACETALDAVRPDTAPEGRAALDAEMGQLQADHHKHISDLSDLRFRLQSALQQQQAQQERSRQLGDWLLRQEQAADEPALLDTLPEKTAEAERLEAVCAEVSERQSQLAQQLGGGSGQLQPLQARCQQLHGQLQEQATRTRQMATEHEEYDSRRAALLQWIEQARQQLQDNSEVVGQLSVLKERRRILEELSDEWCRRSGDVDAVLTLGERLYTHTGPLGRETVRAHNMSLRGGWEKLSDALQAGCQRLDGCLQQFAEFSEQQEQLTRWLHDVEQAMAAHAQLRATLQEKQAQLQSHELTDQEIGAHQALVADVCARAGELITQTQDISLQTFVTSIQALFDTIRTKSKEILDHLSECVQRHEELQTACRQQTAWLTAQRDQLAAADSASGEVSAVLQRRDAVQKVQSRLPQGRRQMKKIHDVCVHTVLGTSESGGAALQTAVAALDDDWKTFERQCAATDARLREAADQWTEYERRQKELTAWCAEHEQLFSQLQLKATLDEKVEVLERLQAARQAIVEREADVDQLIDFGNDLAQLSGLERINTQVKQLSTRYQELHMASQSLLTKWQNMVDDHRAYEEKLAEAEAWLKDTPATDQADQGQHLISSLCSVGERLFPSSSAAGRELVRQQMRTAKDSWEARQAASRAAQEEAAARNQAEEACTEAISQVCTWLDNTERLLAAEPSSWLATTELKAKAQKLKATQSDEPQYRRLLDGVGLRSGLLAGPARTALQSATARLQTASAEMRRQRERLETLLDQLTAHQELARAHQDWCRATEEQIKSVSDTAGGKTALTQRVSRAADLARQLTDGAPTLSALTAQAVRLQPLLPDKWDAALQRELQQQKYAADQLLLAVQEAQHALQSRLSQWSACEAALESVVGWLNEAEATLKNHYTHKNTLEEKEEQLRRFQELNAGLLQQESRLDKLAADVQELTRSSGDNRMTFIVQQAVSRANNVQVMTKDLLSRYEEGVQQHREYVQQYNAFLAEFSGYQEQFAAVQTAPVRRSTLQQSLQAVQQLLAGQPAVSRQLAAVSQLGERLYAATAPDGRQLLQNQLQQLQAAHDALYDQLAATEKQLILSDSKFSGYDESAAELRRWLDETRGRVSQELELKATLDDKCDQLQAYRLLLHEIVSHQQAIADCREKASALPDRTEEVTRMLDGITQQHQNMLDTVKGQVERYEAIVADHQQYTKAVLDAQEFLESTQSAIDMWGRAHGELVTIRANLDKLKQLKAGLMEEAGRVTLVQTLGEKVIPNTSAQGQQNVRAQIESTEQEWQALSSTAERGRGLEAAIASLQRVLDQWSRFEQMKDQWAAWLKETDMKLHGVNLKDTLQQKKDQLEELQAIQGEAIQGEVRARELEIDALTDRAEELSSACSGGRQSQHGQIIAKYQQVSQAVQELVGTWQKYVASHSDYSRQLEETTVWLRDVESKLAYCSDLSATSQKELEAKLATVKDLLLYKDEGFKRVHAAVDLGHQVLRNTEPIGHQAISEQLSALQDNWGSMATRMAEVKSNLDEAIHRWAGFLEEIQRLKRSSDATGAVLQEAARFQTTMAEKRVQLDRLKSLEESLRCEKYEVDSLKSKAAEMSASGNQTQAAAQAQQILSQYDQTADRIRLLRREREEQYKHHRSWKQAFDEFQAWMSGVREKVPAVRQRSFGDRSAIEGVVSALDGIMCKQSSGQLTLEHLVHTGDVMMASTSELGQKEIRQDVANAQQQFDEFFNDIRQQKRNLETIESQLKAYKDEYERLSDWLQAADVQVKQHKTVFVATRDEKQQLVDKIKDVCRNLESGSENITRLQSSASGLLASHLEGYINQQLRHLASRHQVQVNLARDVERKLEAIADQHTEFESALRRGTDWMEEAREVIRGRSGSGSGSDGEPESGKTAIEQHLKAIQELIRNQDEGQTMVHQATSLGEKVLRNTHSSGREDIKQAMKDIQNDWDRFIKKLSNAKVQLETSLLQWSDTGSTYTRLQSWISDREARLQQVLEHKPSVKKDQLASLGEKKAALRRTNSIMQDIVSFQPMIASVTSNSEGARGRRRHASEISDKYETLSRQARQAYERQKQLVEQHGAFIDAAGEFINWLQTARERRAKCAEPTGHKDALASRMTALKLLEADLSEGQTLLDSSLELAKAALQVAEDEEDREVIEEQVAKLQAQMDDYKESVASTRELLESGVVNWTKYEERLKQCQAWISGKETEVQTYGGLHAGLQEKQTAVEAFQTLLSDMYEWQATLDELNVSATLLLDNCADSRIANSVTQLTTQYNALQSLAKDVFRRLEVAHLEHKQHSALCHEIDEWMEKTREKLAETAPLSGGRHSELLTKLHTVQSLRASVEQGQKKLRYAMELKERVIMNTAEQGGTRIQQDADTLRAEFDKLITDIMERKNELTAKIGELDEIFKANQTLIEALDDIDAKIQGDGDLLFSELNEKKTALEKYRALSTEVQSLTGQVAQLRTAADAGDSETTLPEIVQALERHRLTAVKVEDAIKVLEERTQQHEKYTQAYTEAADWLKAARLGLQQAADATGAWEELSARLEANRTLTDALPKGKSLVDEAVSQGEALENVCPAGGHQSLVKDAQALQSEYDSLCKLAASSDASLSRCVSAWSEFTALHDDLRSWLQQVQAKEPQLAADAAAADDQQLQIIKTLWSEVSERRRAVDELADRCETLIELSGQLEVREQAVQLQADHAALLSRLQGGLSQLERRCQSKRDVTAARAELASWLERNRGTVADYRDLKLTVPQLTDNLQMLTVVSTRMTEGQHLLGALQNTYTAAAESQPAEKQQELTEDLTQLRAEYDQLAIELQQATSDVKSQLHRWEETGDTVSQLDTWLMEMTARLDAAPEPAADLAQVKARLERFTDVQKRLESRQPDLDAALEESRQLSADTAPTDGQPTLHSRAESLQERWTEAQERCQTLAAQLQTEVEEFNEYNSSLHDAQKWLLQISYQLMGQNAQYISNREQTMAQIERHKEVMAEFESFSESLRELERRGHSQVERYEEVSPAVRQEVDKQLDNIRSSYSSLLATAQQINTRLLESLKKFEQYETLLESIGENLTARQEQLDEEAAEPIPDLETAKRRLETARDVHNELQSEKSRLDTAVQICEAATASISRPSSPHDHPPDTVPERELQVRCQLELLIDQAQSRLAELQQTADGLQLLQQQEEAVRGWAGQQARLLAELGRQQARLQPEAAAAELERLRELQRALVERQTSLDELDTGRMELAAEPPPHTVRDELDELAEQVAEVLNARTTAQSCVEEYTAALQTSREWYRQTSDSLQAVDSQSAPADGRLQSLTELRRACDEERAELRRLEQLAEAARERLTEPEAQHVTSQVLSTQRSFEELCRRLEQKTESVRSAAEQADRLLDQLRQVSEWTATAQQTAAGLARPIGYTPEAVNDRLNQIQTLETETKAKRSMLPQFSKAISSLGPSISGPEREQLASTLQQMEASVKELCAALETQTAALRRARADRERLQKACADTRQQLTDAADQLQLPEQLPLPATQVQLLIDQRNTLLSQLESVSSRRLPELHQQAEPLLADCSEDDQQRLRQLLQRLQEDGAALRERAEAGRDQLVRVHEARRRLESELEQCRDWLHSAQVTLKQEPLTGTSLHILQEHVHKMLGLQEDYDARRRQLAGVLEMSEQLLPELRPPDKLTLTDQLSTLKTQYSEVGTRVQERTEAFQAATVQQQAINGKISSSITYLTEIKKEIRSLNKPMGSGVEDAQGILSSYEEVLQKLREFRSQLESLQDQTVGSITDLNDLIRQQDELVRAIENQVSKLRNLVLLRQQFLHLLTEITTFLTSHADVVSDVERTDRPVPDKIKQYSGVLAKVWEPRPAAGPAAFSDSLKHLSAAQCAQMVQDIEALLAAAQDKGQQISEEGTVSDRNAILKQLQSLKQQVTQLKRAVENKRRQYEETAERHATLTEQVAAQLDWLHEREAAIKSRPVLTMDDAEIHRHSEESQSLCDESRPALETLQRLVTEADALGPARELPAGLQQQLSQARGLLQTLPAEITDRQTYLQEARRLFDQYRSVKQTVSEWARQVGESVELAENGGEAEERRQAVSRCQTLMSEEAARRSQVSELQETVDRLLPLLAPKPRGQLDANQRQLVVSYDAIVLRASELLEGAARQLASQERVAALLAQVRAALAAAAQHTPPPASQETLREVATQARQARASLDSKLPLLSELRALVDSMGGGGSNGASEADVAQDEWREAADKLDSAASHMDDMIQLWHFVERELLGLESAADAVSDSVESLRPADTVSDRHTQAKQVQTCRTELGQLCQRQTELTPRTADLLRYLSSSQSPAHDPLTERAQQLQSRIDSVSARLEERSQQLQSEAAFSEEVGRRADSVASRLEQHRAALSELDPYAGEQEDTARRLKALQEASDTLGTEVTTLCSELSDHYEHGTPRDVAAKVSRVELLWDGCRQGRADLEAETARAGKVLSDYHSGLESVAEWLGDLDVRLRAGVLDPQQLRAATEELQSELAVTAVTMSDVTRLAGVITERARQQRQRAAVQQAVQQRQQELDAARTRLEKRRAQVMESLDSWSRFIELHDTVRDWMKKQTPLAQQLRTLSTLPEARDALNEYKAAVKECKWATRKLHEMATELTSIGETSSVDALTERMSTCEHDKIETETLLKERMSLLLEMTEEWEQCERKMKDVQAWCVSSRTALESQQARRRPLRDQLAFCEKMSSDNSIQRTRLAMSVDKLGVHFRSGYFDGATVVEERRVQLEAELRSLQTTVDEHCQALGVCVTQLEQYQQDVQTLRSRILEVDQQLRTVSQPAHVARDRDAALAQQEDCRERIKSLHAKITARNERIKLLIQRGKPDPDPLPANP